MHDAKIYEVQKEEDSVNTSVIRKSKYDLIHERSYYNKNGREDMLSIRHSYVPTETIFFD